MYKCNGNEEKTCATEGSSECGDESGSSEFIFFWEKLDQYQSLLRDAWKEYYEALKSLQEEKLEVHKMNMEAIARSEQIRADITLLSSEVLLWNSRMCRSSRRTVNHQKNCLPVFNKVHSFLDGLSAKEKPFFAMDKLSAELFGQPTVENKGSNDRGLENTEKAIFQIRVTTEDAFSNIGTEDANKEFEEANKQCEFSSAEWSKAFDEQNVKCSKMTDAFYSDQILLESRKKEAKEILVALAELNKKESKAETEIQCLKQCYELILSSWDDFLEKAITLAGEKYRLRREKLILTSGTSVYSDRELLDCVKESLASCKLKCLKFSSSFRGAS